MEIRCTRCQHVGEAAHVIPQPSGVALECANCGHHNALSLPKSAPKLDDAVPDPPPGAKPAAPGPREVARALDQSHALPKSLDLLTPQAMTRLVPEPGPGLRCRKCAHLFLASVQNCPRCGLDVDDAHRYTPGHAPWEQAPSGMAPEFDQALLLWEAASADWRQDTVQKFLQACTAHQFQDLAMRKLRFFLVDHEADPLALEALRTVAGQLQTKAFVAKSQAQAYAMNFGSGIKSARRLLLGGIVLFWVVIMVVFVVAFAKTR